MNLSHKLTFSLVFSILCFAAFAFLITPAMAHEVATSIEDGGTTFDEIHDGLAADGETPLTGADLASETNHIHKQTVPTATLALKDNMVGTVSSAVGTNVRLIADLTANPLVFSDLTSSSSDTGNFQIEVTFSEAVFDNGLTTETVPGSPSSSALVVGDFTFTAALQSAPTVNIVGSGISITDVSRVSGDTTNTKFLVTLQVTNARIVANELPINFWISLNANALQTASSGPMLNDGVLETRLGRGNAASPRYKFTVVPEFPGPPLTLTVPNPTMPKGDGNLDFVITASKALGTGDDALTVADIRVAGGTIASLTAGAQVYTLVVTPTDMYTNVSVTIVAAGVKDTAGIAATADVTAMYAAPDLAAPATPVATPGNGQVTLTWMAVPGATGYQYSSNGTSFMDIPGSTNTTSSYTVTDLTNGTRYTFHIRAINSTVGENIGTSTAFPAVIPSDKYIVIPKNSFVVVVRDADATQPGAGGLKFRNDVMTKVWKDMPDLKDLFDRTAPHGGGALILKDVDAATLDVGTVGISEIMWGLDNSYFGNETAEKASQWIELHNLNSTEVTVSLEYLMGSAITATTSGLRGNLARPNIDAITNFFNNRPGHPAWDVKGSSGDSVQARNFVSMARILPDKKDAYANAVGARYNNRDGRHANHWVASSNTYLVSRTSGGTEYKYIGTPGRVNSFKPDTQGDIIQPRKYKPASNTIVINEVGNRGDNKYDWLELRNASNSEINLRNYLITMVRANDKETVLVRFPANDSAKVAAGGVFLILNTEPADDKDHPIAATGYNVDKSAHEQVLGTSNSPVRYGVFSSLVLPNDDAQKFVLMVRKPDGPQDNGPGNDGQGTSEIGIKDLDKIVDIAGYDDNLSKNGYPNSVSGTNLWPLWNFDAPQFTNNKFELDKVHQRNRTSTNNDRSGVGAQDNNNDKTAFGDVGWTGVGYRRKVEQSAAHGGTPGYPNDAARAAGKDITGPVYISEIMYADDDRGSLPQWIEIRNPSPTFGANLHNWRLTVTNHDSMNEEGDAFAGPGAASVLLRDLTIKPNSSVLITSRKGPRSETNLHADDIFILFPVHRVAFGMKNATSDILNTYGFTIALYANAHDAKKPQDWQLVDEVGNLAERRTAVRRESVDTERFDPPLWMWPHALTEGGDRISVARANVFGGTKATGFTPEDGTKASGWILSSQDRRTDTISPTYYGHRDDRGTPGQTAGQPLPVELSFFRPTSENGKVTIQWITESELDNAGFNILRSETHSGEFTKVNEQMIQGKGTTAERTAYKWVDTTAKPGVVYYYQIEDVSFAGQQNTLATTKLKGLISAKGKLTTQWGQLKNLR